MRVRLNGRVAVDAAPSRYLPNTQTADEKLLNPSEAVVIDSLRYRKFSTACLGKIMKMEHTVRKTPRSSFVKYTTTDPHGPARRGDEVLGILAKSLILNIF